MKQILLVLLIGIACINIKAQDYTGYTGCCEQDSMALVAFYNATDGADWYSNQDGFFFFFLIVHNLPVLLQTQLKADSHRL